MPKASVLGKIEKEVDKLSPQDQLRLVEKLVHRLRETGISTKRPLEWSGFYGLGKGLWKEDAQQYVDRMREERA